ncbi:hypothetical protein L8106_16009 [Lyngbya sp. PCC 8106]|nr:hypothetical protein L8106_16009 [Lyngbya sp. PCC 8106]
MIDISPQTPNYGGNIQSVEESKALPSWVCSF